MCDWMHSKRQEAAAALSGLDIARKFHAGAFPLPKGLKKARWWIQHGWNFT